MSRTAGTNRIRGIDLVLTSTCNLRCAYCYQDRKRSRRMDWATVRAAVRLLLDSARDRLELNFYGGEPLLEVSTIRRAVAYAVRHRPRGKRLRFGIITNGTLLDEDSAAFLARHRFDTRLSFDGVRGAQDQRSEDSFPALDALLERLRCTHPRFFRHDLEIGVTLTAGNLPYLADSVEYLLSKGVRQIGVAPRITHEPGWGEESVALLREQLSRSLRSCLRHYRRTGEAPVQLFRRAGKVGERGNRGPLCNAMLGDAPTVDVDGEVVACSLLARSFQRPPAGLLKRLVSICRIGHVADPDLAARLEAYRAAAPAAALFLDGRPRRSSYGRCGDCRHRDDCFVCPVSIAHIPGNRNPRRVPDLQCAFNLAALDCRARFPQSPTVAEWLTGEAPVPQLVRELQDLLAYHAGRRDGARRAGDARRRV